MTHPLPLSVLIAGFGDVGHRIAEALDQQASAHNSSLSVHAIRRKTEQHPMVNVIEWDMSQPAPANLPCVDYVVFCVSADRLTEEGYQTTYVDNQRRLIDALIQQKIPVKHYFFCSSTSVYGQTEHEWINETSTAQPTRFTGKMMLAAEAEANLAPCDVTSIRATGLYGPGRTRMMKQVLAGKVAAANPICYSNRIHVDDLAAFYAHLIIQHHLNALTLAPMYLASDDAPVAIHEVQEWMLSQLDQTIQERVPAGRTGSKRIGNELMKSTGFQLAYSSYKEGMPALLTALKSS